MPPAELNIPLIGAQVFIEPGQTPAEIDSWFRVLAAHGMPLCRIRMFETYMHRADGGWDFELFDLAFEAAARHGVQIFGTIFPATPFTDVGGFKFPRSSSHLQSIAKYIERVVTHFRASPALFGWVLINEPGVGGLAPGSPLLAEEFTRAKLAEWHARQAVPEYSGKGYTVFDFAAERFLLDYTTWFLGWIAEQIHCHDPGRHLHVNNHAIFQNVAEYDFPRWRAFLGSLGGSAHASWHFGYFARSQYALAMAADGELVRSGAGPLPWLMTEVQGGNNVYSGYAAMCPTREEIAQWLWTIVGSGGKGAIFWCLNPRASGFEAGEWAMLDFQDQPTDRLLAASAVAGTIAQHAELFRGAQPVDSGIAVLYAREALWVERQLQTGGPHYEGRALGGVMKSALGYFEALAELGVACRLGALDEYDFTPNDYHGATIILAHQVAIPSRHWASLERFVRGGGKLIVDGLTAYYDERAHCIMKTGFPLAELFGGSVKEFRLEGDRFDVQLADPKLTLPGHCWRGTIRPGTGAPIAFAGGQVAGLRSTFGAGEVFWVPALLGLGGRLHGYGPLADLLSREAGPSIAALPIRFAERQPGMLMRTLRAGDTLITIVVNKSGAAREVELALSQPHAPSVMFADHGGGMANSTRAHVGAEETLVVAWTSKSD
jgi:beta-galactosidase